MTGNILPPFDDGILTKSNHRVIMMMEKIEKYIIYSSEDKALNIVQKDIEKYLSEVKDAVEKDNYRLDRNARRQDNINLFLDYVIDEAKAKEIAYILFQINRRQIGGDHYDREGKKRFLHRVQERDRVPFAEEGHRKEYKG